MTDKLAPCPFCGSRAALYEDDGLYTAHCRSAACGAKGPTRHAEAEACGAWNRRASILPDAAELKRLQQENLKLLEYQHKAEQYDDVVKAVHAADGGRYRNDTIEALLARLKAMEEQANV